MRISAHLNVHGRKLRETQWGDFYLLSVIGHEGGQLLKVKEGIGRGDHFLEISAWRMGG
jgi:hypothetical protein